MKTVLPPFMQLTLMKHIVLLLGGLQKVITKVFLGMKKKNSSKK